MLQPARRVPEPLHSRIIWSTILGCAVLWLAVAIAVHAGRPPEPALAPIAWGAVGVALAGFVGSRALARRPPPPDAAGARTRMVVQLGLSEFGAVFGGVAWLTTGEPWSWAAAGLGLLGILLAFPGRAPGGDASRRLMR